MATIIRRRKLGMSSVRGIVAASKTGIDWVRSDKPLPEDDVYIRWGCTANVPARTVINKAAAIHQVNNKRDFRLVLNQHGLCPKTWGSFNGAVVADPDYPLLVREKHHAQGRGMHVAHHEVELDNITRRLGAGNYYISEIIEKTEEYRVFVMQGRAVWVAKKTPANPEDLAWNVAKGGRFDNVRWGDWPLKAVKTSIEAFNLTDLDFGGVDVMLDAQGNCYVLEINSAPSQTSPYRQESVAKALDYLLTETRDRLPLTQERGGYRKFIHPGVCEEALLVEAQEIEEPVVQQEAQPAPVRDDRNLVDRLLDQFRDLTKEDKAEALDRMIKEVI